MINLLKGINLGKEEKEEEEEKEKEERRSLNNIRLSIIY